ncbi:MAG: serine protease [Gemmataceae bacterium]|nr:serine protease [Gemmataceae bacterium]
MSRIVRLVATLGIVVCSAATVVAGGIPAKTLKELKAASVYIKVQFMVPLGKPISTTGSGFVIHVDGETALIATNHHVVSPLPGEVHARPPQVVFHSGLPQEITVDATIIASDPARDLAIIKVTGVKNLPKPIPIDNSIEVVETMTVYAFGFPFGEGLALGKNNPAITITKGTVSSLRQDDKGQVKLVQIDAEINPGNSGGPVVDEKGTLVGIAVSKIQKARIGFAVPVQPLEEIMQGTVGVVLFDTLKVAKGMAEVHVESTLLDPLGKIKDLAIHYRPADAKTLPPPDKEGRVRPLDQAKRLPLKIGEGRGRGTFNLAGNGQEKLAIVYQASYVNGTGKTVLTPPNLAIIDFTQIIYSSQLTRDDPPDRLRLQPAKRFTHKVKAGKHYVIEMRGDPKQIDPWLIVRDSAGRVVAEDDDSGGLLNALVVVSPPKDDDYQITATVYQNASVGPFTLRIREETAQPIDSKGWKFTGNLSPHDPRDPVMQSAAQTFNLLLKKDKAYVIDMKSRDFDPYLRLENMALVPLKNEDLGGNGHSTLYFTPKQDGIYRLVATTYDYKTGAYEITVAEGLPRKIYEIGPLGLQLGGVLVPTDPIDVVQGKPTKSRAKVFEVKMKAGVKYQIDLTSTQFDPYLRIENPLGHELAFDDDSGGKLNARLIFAPPADGVYRIIATHFDGRFGDFKLSIRATQ